VMRCRLVRLVLGCGSGEGASIGLLVAPVLVQLNPTELKNTGLKRKGK